MATDTKKKKKPESEIQGAVRKLLEMDGWYVIRHQQGMGCHKGLSDLSAIKNGITIYVEIKTPRGVQSDYQKDFQADVESHGAKYIICRDAEDIIPYLQYQPQKLF